MISSEVKHYFKTTDLDEIQDIYEEKLFEFKQFFLSKIPVEKLFRSKINQVLHLQKLVDEVQLTTPQKINEIIRLSADSSIIKQFYTDYQLCKNRIKQHISTAQHAMELVAYIEQLIQLEVDYSRAWLTFDVIDSDVLISKEPDPMEILKSIQEFENNGGKSFDDLKNNNYNPSIILLNEMKRLSLLHKKYA